MALSLGGRIALGLVTLFLLASMGGGIVASPILLPLLFFAASASGRPGRLAFSFLAGLVALEAAWALVFLTFGEVHVAIWAVPLVAFVAATVGYVVASGRAARRRRDTPSDGLGTLLS